MNRVLKLLRTSHELTVSVLANEFNVSQQFISKVESGEKPVPPELLAKYCDKFGMDMEVMVKFSNLKVENRELLFRMLKWFFEGSRKKQIQH